MEIGNNKLTILYLLTREGKIVWEIEILFTQPTPQRYILFIAW